MCYPREVYVVGREDQRCCIIVRLSAYCNKAGSAWPAHLRLVLKQARDAPRRQRPTRSRRQRLARLPVPRLPRRQLLEVDRLPLIRLPLLRSKVAAASNMRCAMLGAPSLASIACKLPEAAD